MAIWKQHKEKFELSSSHVDLWKIDLVELSPQLNLLWKALSEQEQKHTMQFRFDNDRHAFVLAYGALRLLLARYLDCSPHVLCYDAVGTPQIDAVAFHYSLQAPQVKKHLLHSSIAYTATTAIVAISRHQQVGVDLKEIKSIPEQSAIIEIYFSKRERQLLSHLPVGLRTPMFFTYLARKSAFYKAQEAEFSLSLHELDAAPVEHGAAGKADCDGILHGWQIDSLQIDNIHAGAVAISGRNNVIRQRIATASLLLGSQMASNLSCLPSLAV